MNIKLLETEHDGQLWNDFLEQMPSSTVFHRWEWRGIYSRAYNFKTRYWAAFDDEKIIGIFPAVIMRGLNFKKNWVSLPYIQSAGPLHQDLQQISSFTSAVIAEEKLQGVSNFQIRASENITISKTSTLDTYVTMALDLSKGSKFVWEKVLHTQKRSQVRKANKSGMTTVAGKSELLNEFYNVWTRRINQLGTPVFSKIFFREIISSFGKDAWIQVVKKNQEVVGVMLALIHNKKTYEPWAATKSEYNRLGANGMLYWSAIEEAERKGCLMFDMGRSERDSGTFKFKSEWGAKPIELQYVFYPAVKHDIGVAEKYHSLIRLWQSQPKMISNTVGPFISRFLTDL